MHPVQSTSDYIPPIAEESLYSAPLQVAAQHPQDFTVYAPATSDNMYSGLNNAGLAAGNIGASSATSQMYTVGSQHNSTSREMGNMFGASRELQGGEAPSQTEHDSSA